MELVLLLLIGVCTCFAAASGWKGVRYARQHELDMASKSLRNGSLATGVLVAIFTALILGGFLGPLVVIPVVLFAYLGGRIYRSVVRGMWQRF